jgi:hypothetical protein
MKQQLRLMFDTNIFNAILDGNVDLTPCLNRTTLYVTHIQHDELAATRNEVRRNKLLAVFQAANGRRVPTESMVWDVSNWDESKCKSSLVPV